jgi:hypothetical protein
VDIINTQEDEVLTLITTAVGQKVKVHIKSPASTYKPTLVALDALHRTLKGVKRTDWNDRGQRHLTGEDLDDLPE